VAPKKFLKRKIYESINIQKEVRKAIHLSYIYKVEVKLVSEHDKTGVECRDISIGQMEPENEHNLFRNPKHIKELF